MKKNFLSKIILSTAIVTGSVAAPTLLQDNYTHAAQSQDGIGSLTQKNESTLHLSFKKILKVTLMIMEF
ncbi:hypothetical protein [Staphylococcus haemolyticus]|uniref:hypothetical protein n=1 Tax=Staphylococcus haemolyticus TaxID=1283 RepID=UPI0020C00E11|nr:hypothetical protein [Staphylococcus haemolyticus]